MKRRAVLGALGAGVLAGCATLSDPGDDVGCSDAEPRPSRPCRQEDVVRFDAPYDEDDVGGSTSSDDRGGRFALRATEGRVPIGRRIGFTLTNTAPFSSAETANRRHYSVDRYTDDGWRSIYVRDENETPPGFSDEAVTHEALDGFAWEFTLTTEGLAHDHGEFSVCPDVAPGWYRFVFWGLLGDAALGVCFEADER